MDRETARQEIRRNWRQLIPGIAAGEAKTKVNGETSYICPLCGHGAHGDGMTRNPRSIDGNGLKCFGCNFSGDIIDLYQQTTGADYNTALSLLAQEIGVTIEAYRPEPGAEFGRAAKNDPVERPTNDFNGQGYVNSRPAPNPPKNGADRPTEATADYTAYYRECRERLNDPAALAYLTGRGISPATAAAYWIGYDPAADPASNPGGTGTTKHPCPRIIIPTSPAHYVGRSIDPKTPPQFAKMNAKGATPAYFNGNVLYAQDVQEVFIVEGAFDALSIIEAGAAAIAINSTSNADALIKQLESRRTGATLILCLDNDGKPGTAAALQKLREGLTRLNISHVTADICGGYKDPNEALTGDRAAFIEAVADAKHRAAAKPDNVADYIDRLMTADIERFKSDTKTGYANLDRESGGLYGGLYCIAAISSLGKTTFAAQMADQIAAAGTDVLFFSLEQSRLELVSKSIARKTAQKNMETAVTSLSIRKGYLPPQVLAAAEEYKAEVADRISVIEGNFSCNISFIGDYIRQYIRRNNRRPVVFIDYLQILQGEPENGKQSTKEMVDSTVTELKRISRAHDLTVFIISSVNRSNYLTPIDFESLKESGGIEYTCDCIWGLQLQCLNEQAFDKQNNIKERRERIKQAKAESPRKIELVSLKNRYGVATYSCFFEYYPANDLFVPVETAAADFATPPKKAGRRI